MFHGKESGGGPTGHTDFAVDMFQMGSDGSFGYEESLGRLSPIEAFSYQAEHLNLSVRCWAASALLSCDWDTVCSFHEVLYPRFRSSHHPPALGFSIPSQA